MGRKISGGRACGGITYESSVEAEFTPICQCGQCQRISGSGQAAQFTIPAKATRVE